jgi:hypothetical protein
MRTVQELLFLSQEWRSDVTSKLHCSSLALETRLFARQDFAVARLIRAVSVFNLQRGSKASLAAECISADNVVKRNIDILNKDCVTFNDTLHASDELPLNVRFFCSNALCIVFCSRQCSCVVGSDCV